MKAAADSGFGQLDIPQGSFRLTRYPHRSGELLRAWDGADQYLLHHLAEHDILGPLPGSVDGGAVVIVNDDWGALVTALASHQPVHVGDSHVSRLAVAANMLRNGVPGESVTMLSDLDALPPRIDVLVVKIPKSLDALDDQLRRLRPSLHAGTVVIGAGMTRHVHTSTLEVFEQVIGPTRTSLARHKARLVFSTVAAEMVVAASRWPASWSAGALARGGPTVRVVAHANAFSAERLDAGTSLLLEHLRPGSGPEHLVDLGCGTGVVGLALALGNPQAQVTCIDESYQAVASARATMLANADLLGVSERVRCVAGNCLQELDGGMSIARASLDRVVVNPPFHVAHALTDATAWEMFVQSRTALRQGGELWVVGNRHLGYHAKLKRVFGNSELIASNPAFVVLRSVRA